MHIDGHKIPVTNLLTATAFYRDKLEFTIDFAEEQYNWVSIHRNWAELGLYVPEKGSGSRLPGGLIDFSFAIKDFNKYYETLKSREVKISDILIANNGVEVFEVLDPDNNKLVFRKG